MASSEEVVPTAVVGIDTSRPPLGDRAARALVEAVAAGDDRLEGRFLEIKGDLDLKSKGDRAKLTKFILGAANRMPDVAAAAFGGYGVMVIGVANGVIVGVPPVENLDIENAVTPYIGADGPGWDLVRVRVPNSANDVLLLLVDPPQWGQPPFPCLKDGVDLVDGEIYIRTNGKSSKAKSGDIRNLSRRAATGGTPAVAFDVSVGGEVAPVVVDNAETLEAYLAVQRCRLLDALPAPEPEPDPEHLAQEPDHDARPTSLLDMVTKASAARQLQDELEKIQDAIRGPRIDLFAGLGKDSLSALSKDAFLAVDMEPESRSEDDYRGEIAAWEARFRDAWPEAVEQLIGLRVPWVAPTVHNVEEVFLHDVHLLIHLEGDVRGVEADADYDGDVTLRVLDLPRQPRIWGPRKRDFGIGFPVGATFPTAAMTGLYSPARSMTWDNTGSVTATFNIGDLRPGETYECPDSDLILVVDGLSHAPVHGTWKITARDHHKVYSGALTVPVCEPIDLTDELRRILSLDASS